MLLGGTSAQADDSLYLFMIPAELAAGTTGTLDERIEATLHVPDGSTATQLLEAGGGVSVIHTLPGQVTVGIGARNTLATPPADTHRRSSFVIDYNEPAVGELVSTLRAELGEAPSIPALTQFVYEHIDDKHYRSSFDLASRVALTGSGDCTEHAVLLTALARATGKAARVVLGVQLAESRDKHVAFGHAWSEIHDGNAWQVADATISTQQEDILRVRYLPIISLDNEGPGYTLDLMRGNRAHPSRVSGIRSSTRIP